MATTVRRPLDERLLDVRTPAELAVSPQGSVAFALHATVADAGPFVPSDLWQLGPGSELTRLTEGAWSDRTPVWSPTGDRLAFLSDRRTPGHQLPYTMTLGAEPVLAATFGGSAEALAWSAAADALLVQVADPGCYGLDWSARAVTGADPDPDPIRRSSDGPRRRLFLLDVATGKASEVGPPGLSVWEFDWDGADVAVVLTAKDPSGSGWYWPTLRRLDLRDRSSTELYRPTWALEGLALSPGGDRVAVVEGYASDPGLLSGSLMIVDVGGGGALDPWPQLQTVGAASWADDRSLWYARCDGTGTAFGRAWLDGRLEEAWRGDAFVGDEVTKPRCTALEDGGILTTHQAHGLPPELARFDPDARGWRRLSGFNDDLVRDTVFPDARTIRWTAPDGVEIEGVLMTPAGASGPFPLLTLIHGGPTWNWGAFFSDSEPNAVLLANAGYACLLPNPRGSIGRGHAFAQAVIGDPGGVDLADVMAGIDRCIDDGIADPDRLGISGLSYGGFMAGWAVTQTDRFGAAVAMSVVSDNASFFATSEVWGYLRIILGGDPGERPDVYAERSPVTHTHRCRTPTLVLQGERDRCTPVGQGEQLHGAFAAAGIETELVIYPREGHVNVERTHALDAIRRTQAWFDRFLRPEDTAT